MSRSGWSTPVPLKCRLSAAYTLLVLLVLMPSTNVARDTSILTEQVPESVGPSVTGSEENVLPASAVQSAEDPPAAPATEAMLPAIEDLPLEAATGRKLLATNITLLKEQAKAALLASDAFGLVYTGGNFARAIFALLLPVVIAGQTGMIAVDVNYLLNFSQLLAQFVATLGDLLSKGARLTADGIAPI